jgi:hypothetical protein
VSLEVEDTITGYREFKNSRKRGKRIQEFRNSRIRGREEPGLSRTILMDAGSS